MRIVAEAGVFSRKNALIAGFPVVFAAAEIRA
jgi:hypothetical protein